MGVGRSRLQFRLAIQDANGQLAAADGAFSVFGVAGVAGLGSIVEAGGGAAEPVARDVGAISRVSGVDAAVAGAA